MDSRDVTRIFILLVDISGYTRFIKYHKTALLHAEKIVAELMEAMLAKVKAPVIAHEILGDAISMYALDMGVEEQPDQIYHQLQEYFDAFWVREASLISACELCPCDACKQVGKLRLKAILHSGEAVFTSIMGTQKISGEDIIIAHRLLKNSVPSDEYILMTEAFATRCKNLDLSTFTLCVEECEGIGRVRAFYRNLGESEIPYLHVSAKKKWADFLKLEMYMISRWFKPGKYSYTNLPNQETRI